MIGKHKEMHQNIESELCAGTNSSVAAKGCGWNTSYKPGTGAIVQKPDRLAVMTRFQQIARRPSYHFGELSARSSQEECEGNGSVAQSTCPPRQVLLRQLLHWNDGAGSSLHTVTNPAGVLIQDKVNIILPTHLIGN